MSVNDAIDAVEDTKRSPARVTYLPSYSGDGYGYGGGVILSIGNHAIPLGEGYEATKLAEEIARRWNAMLEAKSP